MKVLRRASLMVLFGFALTICPAVFGQATGSFSGNVVDKSGIGIVGADCDRKVAGHWSRADDYGPTQQGTISCRCCRSAPIRWQVDDTGFQSAASKDLRLQVDEARELDFSLGAATVVTSVSVTGDAVAVDTASPSLGQVITQEEVSQLPLNGRDFVQLATLTSGATAETSTSSFFTTGASSEVAARRSFSLSVGGSRPNSTDWLLDGVDNNELTAGRYLHSVLDRRHSRVQGADLHLLGRVRNAGGSDSAGDHQVRSDAFHGSLFEFFRNTALNSQIRHSPPQLGRANST